MEEEQEQEEQEDAPILAHFALYLLQGNPIAPHHENAVKSWELRYQN